jgi:hypothetical protein
MIAYYERDDAEPPGAQLAPLATALRVTTDELLGLAPITKTMRPRTARLLKRLQQIEGAPRRRAARCPQSRRRLPRFLHARSRPAPRRPTPPRQAQSQLTRGAISS